MASSRLAGVIEKLSELAELGVDRAVASPELVRRIRVLTMATCAMSALGIGSWVELLRLGLVDVAIFMACTVLLGFANLALLRVTHRPEPAAHFAVLLLASIIGTTAVATGGFYAPNFGWVYVIPLCAMIVLPLRGAFFWTVVSMAGSTVFWVLPELGLGPISRIPEAMQAENALTTRLLGILAMAGAGASFVAAQRRAEKLLARTSDEHGRETAYVELLMHAAVSANEAASFEAALGEGVERICRAMGWFAGHICLVDDDGSVRSSGHFWVQNPEIDGGLRAITRERVWKPGEGLAGRAVENRRPVYVGSFNPTGERGAMATAMGFRSALAVPIFANETIPAVLEFVSVEQIEDVDRLIEVFTHIGVQLGHVAERVALQDRIRQAQKMEAVGQLAAGIAHEINNPMAYVRSNLNSLRNEIDDIGAKILEDDAQRAFGPRLAECRELVDESLEGVERTIGIVRDVKALSHSGGGEPTVRQISDLSRLVDGALRVAVGNAPPDVHFTQSYGSSVLCECLPNQLTQVFINLIVNAIQAVGDDGTISLRTGLDGEEVFARVSDSGPGMTENVRRRLFDPFFTTKSVGEGTGLGLSVSYEIIRSHDGQIRVDSSPGEGATFEVRLPRAHAPAEPEASGGPGTAGLDAPPHPDIA